MTCLSEFPQPTQRRLEIEKEMIEALFERLEKMPENPFDWGAYLAGIIDQLYDSRDYLRKVLRNEQTNKMIKKNIYRDLDEQGEEIGKIR